jgi:Xaa-Pro aminopeptidase
VAFSQLEDYIRATVKEKSRISVINWKNPWAEWMEKKNYKVETDLKNIVHEMRVIKDDLEKEHIQKAVDVTVKAHQRILNTLKNARYEYHVRAEIEYVYHSHHCEPAFPSITGAGDNACYLHYEDHSAPLKEGDLILVDIGAKYKGYCGDVTRTYPVSGRFTDRQKELYNIIYGALKTGLTKMSPSHHFFDAHNAATAEIVRGLYGLGLITDTTSVWQKMFYIHYRNSHYLGADVHDVGYYGQTDSAKDLVTLKHRGRKLEEGMVLTLEPGIYLMRERIEQLKELFPFVSRSELEAFYQAVAPVYKLYAGIGIRLEEDVLINKNGHVVLSAEAPLSIEDIEKALNP